MTVQEIKSEQIKILDEIRIIHINSHSTKDTKCSCPDCQKIKRLGEKYEKLTKYRREMRKGPELDEHDDRLAEIAKRPYILTKEDLEYMLIERLMSQKEVGEHLGVSPSTIAVRCREHRMNRHYIQQERRRRHGLVE